MAVNNSETESVDVRETILHSCGLQNMLFLNTLRALCWHLLVQRDAPASAGLVFSTALTRNVTK